MRAPRSDRPPRVDLWAATASPHLTQLFTGFALLHRAGVVDVRLHREPPRDVRTAANVLRATTADGVRIVYDVQDHADLLPAELAWSTAYMKRSYRADLVAASNRPDVVSPLGLNVPVQGPGDHAARQAAWLLRQARSRGLPEAVAGAVGYSVVADRLVGRSTGRWGGTVADLEQVPDHAGRGVVHVARTWDPAKVGPRVAAMREELNHVRVEGVRALRAHVGADGLIGLVPTAHAVFHHPDLVLSPAQTRRARFLARVRDAAVCVTSAGLRNSNGWRLAEFVAASRPIVTEPLRHELPGDFAPGTTHVTFDSVDTMVEAVVALLDDAERRAELRQATHRYYRRRARPDALVARSLEAAGVTAPT